jgi:hypothetical protein
MKQAINLAGPTVKIIDSPIPEPNDDQVLIKVVVSGSNPKDWKVPDLAAAGDSRFGMMLEAKKGVNQGDDIAGIIERVGANVVEFKVHNTTKMLLPLFLANEPQARRPGCSFPRDVHTWRFICGIRDRVEPYHVPPPQGHYL